MLIIEGIRIKNFRVLKDITLGRTNKQSTNRPLTSIIAVIGKNGSGKSTLFDAFVFLNDCFQLGVESACNHKNRGGFERLISSGCNAPICFELTYQNSADEMHFFYELAIDLDQSGRPVILEEKLIQSLEPDMHCVFLHFQNSKGIVWADNKNDQTKEAAHLQLELTDNNRPAVSVFGSLKDYPQLTHLKQYIQKWYITDFSMDAARSIPKAGPQKQLSEQGDNIANVVQLMEREHKARFHNIIKTIS